MRTAVSDLLSERTVVFLTAVLTPADALETLVSCLDLPDPSLALRAILEREKTGSTVLRSQIAVPHARLKALTKIRAAIGIRKEPADDPIRVYVLFVSPSEDTKSHLHFLADVSQLFEEEGLVESLCGSSHAGAALEMIKAAER